MRHYFNLNRGAVPRSSEKKRVFRNTNTRAGGLGYVQPQRSKSTTFYATSKVGKRSGSSDKNPITRVDQAQRKEEGGACEEMARLSRFSGALRNSRSGRRCRSEDWRCGQKDQCKTEGGSPADTKTERLLEHGDTRDERYGKRRGQG